MAKNQTHVVQQAPCSPDMAMAVPQTQETIQRNAISDKSMADSRAEPHSKGGFFDMLPTMAVPLREASSNYFAQRSRSERKKKN